MLCSEVGTLAAKTVTRHRADAPYDLIDPGPLFPTRANDTPRSVMNPLRVTPIWIGPSKPEDIPLAEIAYLIGVLEQNQYTRPTLTPLTAGYSGAQPFLLACDEGHFFVKAAFNNRDAAECIEYEVGAKHMLAGTEVTPNHRLFARAESPRVTFSVCDFTENKHLEEEPLRSELVDLTEIGRCGPFLLELMRVFRAFHLAKIPDGTRATLIWDTCEWEKRVTNMVNAQHMSRREAETLLPIVKRVERAFEKRQRGQEGLGVFLHGDMHASNIRYNRTTGRLTAIDLDGAGLGDPARELGCFANMMDIPMREATTFVRLYQKEVIAFDTPFYERALLALAGERIGHYALMNKWSGQGAKECLDLQRRIEEDLRFVWRWL